MANRKKKNKKNNTQKTKVRTKYDLTYKQVQFIEAYMIEPNATKAAHKAGYSKKSSRQQGARLLSNAAIKAEIQRRMDARAIRMRVTADDVLKELVQIGFSDIYRYIDFDSKKGMTLKDPNGLTQEMRRCVAEVSDVPGAYGHTRKIKLKDSLRALEMIAKHLKLLGGDEAVQAMHSTEELAQTLRYLMEHGYKPPNPMVRKPD